MSFALSFARARTARPWSLALVLSAGLAPFAVACSGAAGSADDGASASGDEAVTDVDQSSVKRQSIGNCWIYATAGWVESLNKTATGAEMNVSESYWTYWHWFEQITSGQASSGTISTGGSFDTAAGLITRYGVMTEGDFIASEATAEMSAHQDDAEQAIDAALKTGALKTPAARKNRATVRAALDHAWGLSPNVVAQLDKAFGTTVSKTLDKTASTAGTNIKTATSIAIAEMDPTSKQVVHATLADAIGKKTSTFGARTGAMVWNEVDYPSDAQGRRDFQKRVQRALNDHQPAILSWFVDFNALDDQGRFMAPPSEPGRQGGHMTVMEDYEVDGVPGFGTLPAGVLETRPAALDAALSDQATIHFFRVKNSWGSFRPDRQFVLPGYHDLYMEYLNGPVKQCQVDADENPDPSNCWDTVPFQSVVLPKGY